MEIFFDNITVSIAATELQPADLITLGLISLLAMGSLLVSLGGRPNRSLFKLARYLGCRLWNKLIDRLMTLVILVVLGWMASLHWLTDLVKFLVNILGS
jgi:hypothetical protein